MEGDENRGELESVCRGELRTKEKEKKGTGGDWLEGKKLGVMSKGRGWRWDVFNSVKYSLLMVCKLCMKVVVDHREKKTLKIVLFYVVLSQYLSTQQCYSCAPCQNFFGVLPNLDSSKGSLLRYNCGQFCVAMNL